MLVYQWVIYCINHQKTKDLDGELPACPQTCSVAATGDALGAPPPMAGTRALHPLKLRVRWAQAEHHVEAQPQDTVPRSETGSDR